MVVIECTAGCGWSSADRSEAFAAVLAAELANHTAVAHAAAAPVPAATPASQPKIRLDPPKIATGTSAEDWESFKRLWSAYRSGMAIPVDQRATHLLYCCDRDLQDDLMRSYPDKDITAVTETDLLEAINKLAVKQESELIHRIKMSKLVQTPGMGIRNFLAQLKGQAKLCQYKVKCSAEACDTDVDFSEEMIKDHLIRGIADNEILADLLGDSKTDRTLSEVVDFIATKEQAKMERGAMDDSSGSVSNNRPSVKNKKCWACGEPAHGDPNNRRARAEHCKAWETDCTKCQSRATRLASAQSAQIAVPGVTKTNRPGIVRTTKTLRATPITMRKRKLVLLASISPRCVLQDWVVV